MRAVGLPRVSRVDIGIHCRGFVGLDACSRPLLVFGASAAVGLVGGMIGLGGAEFRLPLLIGIFGFAALSAVILNKAMSLIVVLTAIPARLLAVPLSDLTPHWTIVVNLLAGSLLGAWLGASWATRMRSVTLYKVLAVLLVLIAAALAVNHLGPTSGLDLDPAATAILGLVAGTGIGVVAALMGVAGGELLIPTIVLLYGLDIKIAGSLSLAVSLPTMLVAFARYSRDSQLCRAPRPRPIRCHHGSSAPSPARSSAASCSGSCPTSCSSPRWWCPAAIRGQDVATPLASFPAGP